MTACRDCGRSTRIAWKVTGMREKKHCCATCHWFYKDKDGFGRCGNETIRLIIRDAAARRVNECGDWADEFRAAKAPAEGSCADCGRSTPVAWKRSQSGLCIRCLVKEINHLQEEGVRILDLATGRRIVNLPLTERQALVLWGLLERMAHDHAFDRYLFNEADMEAIGEVLSRVNIATNLR